ncbi:MULTISPECIES: DUF3169 family protein [Staphylococcus]|uniref:DUF3169 family protein n=2 Tax=Staphylococcus condimenti TaxID=70255 RepID=A0AB37GXL9_9STAP|nr:MULTISPECIES: DUF3169 family protein [Staphylococcus]AMY06416.1 hypothetical protein A4G25_10940 [Staphylococcus condimenti]APR60298.1 hypothetical protein BTZ13_03355 [Staphylococcus condimenti]MDK8644241.1 DUF3169 family protein [Staphylococcus condimenti]OFP00260.1 hypothetical protein HMPREF3007_11785 [Staphylococcus sp. HMSC065E08]QQS81777.1 DUF3169 family protein [Staphylococcus condimenti]
MSNTKKNTLYLSKILLGGLVGGIIGFLFSLRSGIKLPAFMDVFDTQVSTGITILIVIICGIFMLKYLRSAYNFKQKSETLENYADEYNQAYNQKFLKASWFYQATIVITLLNMILVAIFKENMNNQWGLTTIPLLISAAFAISYNIMLPKIDPRLPKYNDSNYIGKMISAMDEGEKYISYSALFKLYHYNIMAIMMMVILLAFYSAATHTDQFIALSVLMVLYIFNIVFYYAKISKYYKQ